MRQMITCESVENESPSPDVFQIDAKLVLLPSSTLIASWLGLHARVQLDLGGRVVTMNGKRY